MKSIKYILSIALAGTTLFSMTSCDKDDLVDINKNKTGIVNGSPEQIFAQAVMEFEPSPYMLWFNNSPTFYSCAQMAVPAASFNADVINGASRQGFQSITLLKYINALKNLRSTMSEEENAKYQSLAAALDVLSIYLGIYDTDDCGDIPFTEAANARYGGTLTPKYDRVADLYTLWLGMLDNAIKTMTTAENQTKLNSQDIIYTGDMKKWAKFANSLKLKIAARLIHQDFTRAKTIAQEVVSASCGVLDGEGDDIIFRKSDQSIEAGDGNYLDKGDVAYHTTNTTLAYNGTSAAKKVVNFMLKNKDPRVRFLYTKNQWNSKIVNWFLEAGRKADIPSFIAANIETETDAEGVEHFKAWTGMGEPWIRYYGLPDELDAQTNSAYAEYFRYSTNKAGDKAYMPFSIYNEELVQGRVDFTLPTCPDDVVLQDTEDNPWYGMYITSAEVNLYLAEFATYGAISGNANDYFQKALTYSVKAYDRLAKLNKIPYYFDAEKPGIYSYDANEKSIALADGEIDAMLANTDYQLTGDKDADLEKIFIQQLIHFSYAPKDLFVTARRSGCPKIGSTLLPRTVYSTVPVEHYARRTTLTEPLTTNLMYNILIESYKTQGFTWSLDKGTTNTQRVWQDQGAPQYGAGPNVK